MTVNELIQQLQEIPDGLKNCEVVMRQYNGCCKYAVTTLMWKCLVQITCYTKTLLLKKRKRWTDINALFWRRR